MARRNDDARGGGQSREDREQAAYAREKTQLTTMQQFLNAGKAQLQAAVQKHMDPDRLVRLALNAAARNQKLLACSTISIARALMQAGAIGLEPDGREGHLVPFWNSKTGQYEAVFMPDYKGFVKLAYQSNMVASVEARAVHEGDEFEFEFGTNARLRHVPNLKSRGETIAAWCMVTFRDGKGVFNVLSLAEIHDRREASKSKDDGPWRDWFDEMAVKSAFKVLAKFLPLGPHFRAAVDVDDGAEIGEQRLPAGMSSDILDQFDAPARTAEPGAIEHRDGPDNPIPKTASQQVRERVRAQRGGQAERTAERPPLADAPPREPGDEPPDRPAATQQPKGKAKADPLLKLPSEPIDGWVDRMLGAIPLIPTFEELERIETDIVPRYVRDEFLPQSKANQIVAAISRRLAELEADEPELPEPHDAVE